MAHLSGSQINIVRSRLISHFVRSSGAALYRVGIHHSGTESVRPSVSATCMYSSSKPTSWIRASRGKVYAEIGYWTLWRLTVDRSSTCSALVAMPLLQQVSEIKQDWNT